jgi:hypothetical protein
VARDWGRQAFDEARAHRRPVLLVVGRLARSRDRAATTAVVDVLHGLGGERRALLVTSDPDEWPEVGDFARVAASTLGAAPAFPVALLLGADAMPRAVVSGEVAPPDWAEAVRALLMRTDRAGSSGPADEHVTLALQRAQHSAPAPQPLTRAAAIAAAGSTAPQPIAGLLGPLLLLVEAEETARLPGAREAAMRELASGRTTRPATLLAGAWRLLLETRVADDASRAEAATMTTWITRDLVTEAGLFRAGVIETDNGGDRAIIDDRIFTEANGLAIAALTQRGSREGRPADVEAAKRAAEALLARVGPPAGLRHGFDGERSLGPARLGDYAALGLGLVSLYDVTGERRWLLSAQALADAAIRALWDSEGDGFYLTPEPHEPLPLRVKTGFDDEGPSANAVMAIFLGTLSDRSGRPDYRDLARRTVQAFAGDVLVAPSGMEGMLAAALYVLPSAAPVATAIPVSAPVVAGRVASGPLVLELLAARTVMRAGEGTDLRVRLSPSSGFVVTPHSATGRGIAPLSVALLESDLAAGLPSYPPPLATGAFDAAVIPIRVPASAPSGPRPARVSVRCQICTAEGDCRAPVRVTLEVGLTIVAR